jgi:CheY-like chemotaxis protein
MMPEMDGCELATVLREEGSRPRRPAKQTGGEGVESDAPAIPVIGLTGNVEPGVNNSCHVITVPRNNPCGRLGNITKCEQAGMIRVLPKPIEMASLIEAITAAHSSPTPDASNASSSVKVADETDGSSAKRVEALRWHFEGPSHGAGNPGVIQPRGDSQSFYLDEL